MTACWRDAIDARDREFLGPILYNTKILLDLAEKLHRPREIARAVHRSAACSQCAGWLARCLLCGREGLRQSGALLRPRAWLAEQR